MRPLFRRLYATWLPGRVYGIVGENGSGKSTLMRMIAGLWQPHAGRVDVRRGPEVLSPLERRAFVNLVAPYYHVYEDLSLREQLAFVVDLRQTDSTTPDAETTVDARRSGKLPDQLLSAVQTAGLDGVLDEPLHSFSTGMLQRARMLAGLAHPAPIILLDEATSNLDPAGIEWVASVVRSEVARNALVVIATNVSHELAWCDEVLDLSVS